VAIQAFTLDDNGGTVLIEIDDDEVGSIDVGRRTSQAATDATKSFEQTFSELRPALDMISRQLRDLSPDGLTVEFGVKVTMSAGAVIAKASGEAHFTVKLHWPTAIGR
jgi:hypothetical protein